MKGRESQKTAEEEGQKQEGHMEGTQTANVRIREREATGL